MTPSDVYARVAGMDRPLTRREAQEYLLTLAVLNAASDENVRALDIAHVLTASAAGAEAGDDGTKQELLDFVRGEGS